MSFEGLTARGSVGPLLWHPLLLRVSGRLAPAREARQEFTNAD